MLDIIDKLERRLADLDQEMADPAVLADQAKLIEFNRERRRLQSILASGYAYRERRIAIDEASEIIDSSDDPEMVAMAQEELEANEAGLEQAENDFKLKLLPHDPTDEKPAIIEIRAGTGGEEAGLFVGDLFRMYQRYADEHDWKMQIMNSSASGSGGFKEIIFQLEGDGAYGRMKYESGVHRVQRVPATETQGRIHTSAVTVAVFPQADQVDIAIKENEIKVDVYRSSGPGGQSVNTTDSAVRITHLPTGLVVTCQDEKSQLKNKNKAMLVLRARLYDMKVQEQQSKIAAQRRNMVSTGDRSAKIRTYNYPQSRVTDHRINLTLYKLNDVINGQVDFIIDALVQHDQEIRLKLHESGELA
ncbi:MAG: peptide chain release factor 1 [bacterium]